MQKKKEEEAAREKELNELFKVAISQPKVPVGMLAVAISSQLYFVSAILSVLPTIFITSEVRTSEIATCSFLD